MPMKNANNNENDIHSPKDSSGNVEPDQGILTAKVSNNVSHNAENVSGRLRRIMECRKANNDVNDILNHNVSIQKDAEGQAILTSKASGDVRTRQYKKRMLKPERNGKGLELIGNKKPERHDVMRLTRNALKRKHGEKCKERLAKGEMHGLMKRACSKSTRLMTSKNNISCKTKLTKQYLKSKPKRIRSVDNKSSKLIESISNVANQTDKIMTLRSKEMLEPLIQPPSRLSCKPPRRSERGQPQVSGGYMVPGDTLPPFHELEGRLLPGGGYSPKKKRTNDENSAGLTSATMKPMTSPDKECNNDENSVGPTSTIMNPMPSPENECTNDENSVDPTSTTMKTTQRDQNGDMNSPYITSPNSCNKAVGYWFVCPECNQSYTKQWFWSHFTTMHPFSRVDPARILKVPIQDMEN
jgi:hypothetical protein